MLRALLSSISVALVGDHGGVKLVPPQQGVREAPSSGGASSFRGKRRSAAMARQVPRPDPPCSLSRAPWTGTFQTVPSLEDGALQCAGSIGVRAARTDSWAGSSSERLSECPALRGTLSVALGNGAQFIYAFAKGRRCDRPGARGERSR